MGRARARPLAGEHPACPMGFLRRFVGTLEAWSQPRSFSGQTMCAFTAPGASRPALLGSIASLTGRAVNVAVSCIIPCLAEQP